MDKKELRLFYKKTLENLSEERKKEAQRKAFLILKKKVENFSSVLSFASMKDEIDLSVLNIFFAEKNILFLPKVEGGNLSVYRVDDISKLKKNDFIKF
jgi:5-formyltetrahydrofolate cyclo-ligase